MNNNPFEPVAPEPAELTPTDNSADNFSADSDNFGGESISVNTKAPRTGIAIDGINPKLDSDFNSQSIGNDSIHATLNNAVKSPVSSPVVTVQTPDSNDDLLTDDIDKNSLLENVNDDASRDKTDAKLSSSIEELDQVDKVPDNKPTKKFTISVATIVFFILTLAGIGGTVYFYMQNNDTSNKLADAKAQVDKLNANSSSSTTSNNKSNSQYDALQNKITDLTSQNADKQKTLDDNKKTIDQLNAKNADLTKSNDDLTKKVQNISDLTTKVDTMVNKLNNIYANQ